MEPIRPPISTIIPTIDISPFIDGGDESCRKKVRDEIAKACNGLGVFQITIHRDSLKKCEKVLKLTQKFFDYPDEVKKESTIIDLLWSGAGYGKANNKYHHYEYLLMHSPDKPYNGVPHNHHDYRETYEEVFKYFVETSQIVEEIISENLGLCSNFLKNFNDDRCWDIMFPMYYTPTNETKEIGIDDHEDPNMMTLVLQDDVSGLEFFKDGEYGKDGNWIPLIPQRGTLVVIVGDLIQVLSNKKVRHVRHRALIKNRHKRLAIDFVYNLAHHKSVYPLPQLIGGGDTPKYRKFKYQEYVDMIMEERKRRPLPSRVEDFLDITYFEI